MGENSGMGRTNEKTIMAGEMEEGIPTPIKPYPGKQYKYLEEKETRRRVISSLFKEAILSVC